MNPLLDPIEGIISKAFVTTQVKTSERLGFSQQAGNEFDCGNVQAR